MKLSGYRAANILLLVIYCLWRQVQPTAGGKCSGPWAIHACAGGNGKRSDVGDVAQAIDLGGAGEGPDIEEERGGERTGGGWGESDGYRGSREGDDLRSEFNDGEQLLEERQLLNIGSRRIALPPHRSAAPLNPALGRLRSLLRTTRFDYDKGVDEQAEEEEPPRGSSTDTNRRYINNLAMLRRILDDIAVKHDSLRSHDRSPDSAPEEQVYGAAEDNYYELQKRVADN